jgi:hypothetical protein
VAQAQKVVEQLQVAAISRLTDQDAQEHFPLGMAAADFGQALGEGDGQGRILDAIGDDARQG